MSFKQGNRAMEDVMYRIDSLYNEVANMIIADAKCLDGNPRKDEIIQTIILRLDAKRARCKSDANGSANRACAIRFSIMLGNLENANEEAKHIYAQQIAKEVWHAGIGELQLLPEDLQEQLFTVAVQYFNQ